MQKLKLLPVLLLAVAALLLCLHANRFGADILPDSGDYITAGIRLSRGEGFSIPNRTGPPAPLTWFPPLFSTVIAAVESLHLPIYRSVGDFNAGCYALLVLLTGLWIRRAGGNWICSAAGAAIVLTNHAVYLVHSIVLSEPMFLLFVTGCLWSLATWRSSGKLRFAALAGIMAALATLTRYAGISLLPTAFLLILLSLSRNWKQKFSAVFLTTVIGLLPAIAWSRIHTPPHQAATGRTLQWHPITRDCIQDGLQTLSSFVLPEDHHLKIPSIGLLALGLILTIGSAILIARSRHTSATDLDAPPPYGKSAAAVTLIFAVTYLLFLVASISLLDADTPLDERILSPLVVPLAVLCCVGLSAMTAALRSTPLRFLIALLFMVALFQHSLSLYDPLHQRQSPEDLAWYPTLQSDTLDSLRDIPANEAVWSDKPCAIYMAYRLRTDALPDRPTEPTADPQSAADYAEAIQILRDQLTDAGGGWVVLWHQLADFGDGFLNEDDIRKNFVTTDQEKFDDGLLLRIDDPQATPPAKPGNAAATAP
jgi:hypothetical protein